MVCESLLSTHESHLNSASGNSDIISSMQHTDSSNIQELMKTEGNKGDDFSKHSDRSKFAVEVASAAALVTQYLTSEMYHGSRRNL